MINDIAGMLSLETRSFVSAVTILVVGTALYLLARRGLKHLARRGSVADPLVRVLQLFLRWIFIIVVLLFVFQELGILDNVWAAVLAVAAMVAVGFIAVWSILSNVLCTLLILIFKPFRIGDTVEITTDALKGEVIDLNLMFTTLIDEEEHLIQVPNNVFFQKAIRRKQGTGEVHLYDQFLKPQG